MSKKSPSTSDDRRARSEQMKAEREAAARASERRTRLLVVVAVLAAVALIGVAVVGTQSGGGGDDVAVPSGVEAPDGGIAWGDDAAPVVLDEWMDFYCSACASFEAALGPTIDEEVESGNLRVLSHPLTFTSAEYSPLAANAFGCAADQGDAPAFHDAVFEALLTASEPLGNEDLVEIGAEVGITSDEFATCVNEGQYDGWVTNVGDSMLDAGVTATPTIFLNGESVELEEWTPEALTEAIEAAKGDQ